MARLDLKSQAVRLEGVTKRFGKTVAVDRISFTARAGKLTTLLGPSGCGKTTTLRMLGGFYEPEGGDIFIGNRRVNDLPPYARSTRTVFQSYALFPHMTVFENVAFGLRATRTARREIKPRVNEALELVGLGGFGDRQSGQLSGGQQQRVAFARALVTRPEVLLLDEPLSNLDAKLRIHMRGEIRKLQQDLGITTIYVTHDQGEALSLSDHVIIMSEGRIEQEGPPHDIYERPASRFVADFIGTSNFVQARVTDVRGDRIKVETLGTSMTLPRPDHKRELANGDPVTLVLRPEHLHFASSAAESDGGIRLAGNVLSVSYLGAEADYVISLASGETVTVQQPAPTGSSLREPGSPVELKIDEERVYVIPDSAEGAAAAQSRATAAAKAELQGLT